MSIRLSYYIYPNNIPPKKQGKTKMFQKLSLGHDHGGEKKMKEIKGGAVLMKKNVLDFNDFNASILDTFDEFLGKRVSFQLVSSVTSNPGNDSRGKVGKASYLGEWAKKLTGLTPGESAFNVTFEWDEGIMGIPGALIVKNEHQSEFYLKTVTLEDVPSHGNNITFVCNSWVYPSHRYNKDRIFFTNQAYLPHQTPEPLSKYREEELKILRGNGHEGKLEEWDRVYDYAYYNDLGDPDKGPKYVRPVLGGSAQYPYPRRGKTGRLSTKTDPNTESRLPLLKGLEVYVPRDERFGHLKMSDFLGDALKSLSQDFLGGLEAVFDKTPLEFDSFQDELSLYEGGIKLPDGPLFEKIRENIPFEFLKNLLQSDGAPLLKFPMPDVIKVDKSAWRTDEEFAREMLAGVNPLVIRRLEVFPPVSKLDPEVYGNQHSSITKEHIEHKLEGLSIEDAIKSNKLFILDHHDILMPYVRKINSTASKIYATRTVLFLQNDGTLKPLAIELSLPHPNGDQMGCISKVFTPAHEGVQGSLWQLAKAYVTVDDSGHHQLISHWSRTHAVMEPFVIATNRQLSVLHPIYKLLQPHFRDTMYINAVARQILLNAEGLLEKTVFPSKYAMEFSSAVYKDWVFTEQALPQDLVKRGMAVKDSQSNHGYKLLIEDYPYAVDGLEIWSTIETWVKEYCSFYYKSDNLVADDKELQSWWQEIREKGHGDKKDEKWWPKMNTIDELTETCTTIIWVASALHAAVNFGQYPYAGYHPNRPTISRRFMPEPGTPEYEELKTKPESIFLKTITSQIQTLLGISLIELLSRHSSDEVYLGQRDTRDWTSDIEPLEAFERFGKKLEEIEDKIMERNSNGKWKNRVGPVKLPYTLLYPTSGPGLTGKGIPNSTSI